MISRYLISISLVVLIFTLLLNACNPNPAQTSSTDAAQRAPQDSPARNTEIPLYSLTVTDSYFHKTASKKKNIFLSYIFGATNVTLQGWGLKKVGNNTQSSGKFDGRPDLVLSAVEEVPGVTIGPNTFMGTQVIYSSTVDSIRDAIGTKNTILYFTPMKRPDTVGSSNFKIVYKISIKEVPLRDNKFLADIFATNPAPPHQAYD